MWIDRLDFIGFGNLTGQRIDFGKNKVSVIVQPNEYGKSTISEAVLAMLYGYADATGTEHKPLSGAVFKACMDLSIGGRSLRLIRSFGEHSLKVLDLTKDLGKAGADITAEFAESIAADDFGIKLTGLSRKLFASTCMLGQRELDSSPFAGDRSLSSMLLNIADSGGAATNVFDAIARIEEALQSFSFKGKSLPIDQIITGLEETRAQLQDTLKRLEGERQECDHDMERLAELESRLQRKAKEIASDEYFQLCLEAAEIESRINHTQEKMARVRNLQQKVQSVQQFAVFPIDMQKPVEELWMRRLARISDLQRLEGDLFTESGQISRSSEQSARPELEQFTLEDAQMLTGLAGALQQAVNELQETVQRQAQETERVQRAGVDLKMLGGVRQSLLQLTAREMDDAHSCYAMVVNAREKLDECERSVDRARTEVKEINEQRYRFCNIVDKVFWVSLVTSAILLIPLASSLPSGGTLASVVATLYCTACVLAGLSYFGSQRINRKYRVEQLDQARTEEQRQQVLAQELLTKIGDIEQRLGALARKAGLRSADNLVRNMQEYGLAAAQLKELDFLEQLGANNRAKVERLKNEMSDFFRRANRPLDELCADSALKLADDINRCVNERRYTLGAGDPLGHREAELRFIADDIKETDAQLLDFFQKARIGFDGVEDGFAKYCDSVAGYRLWEALSRELERMQQDMASDTVAPELPKTIERLESKRADLLGRMEQLISANPEIADMQPPSGDSLISSMGKEMSDLRLSLEELRGERDELIVQIRANLKSYQDSSVQVLEELEVLEQDLQKVRKAQTSLLLSRDTFAKLAEENHSVWADKLTDITREMLKHLGTEYESLEFDADLSITVRRKGQREPVTGWHIANQLSTGTREQLHWLARLAVVRYLSKEKSLPIILDEPFSEFDDERFLKIMRFLINTIAPSNQVIIFSCHQQRHDWLMDHLDPREQERIELCGLTPLVAESRVATKL